MALASSEAATDSTGIDGNDLALALWIKLLEHLLNSLSNFHLVGIFLYLSLIHI